MLIWAWAVPAVSARRPSIVGATAHHAARRWRQSHTSHPVKRPRVLGETASNTVLIARLLLLGTAVSGDGATSTSSPASQDQGDEPATQERKAGRLGNERRRHESLRRVGDATKSYDVKRTEDPQNLNRCARLFEHMELVD